MKGKRSNRGKQWAAVRAAEARGRAALSRVRNENDLIAVHPPVKKHYDDARVKRFKLAMARVEQDIKRDIHVYAAKLRLWESLGVPDAQITEWVKMDIRQRVQVELRTQLVAILCLRVQGGSA